MQFNIGSATNIGQRRSKNQDNFSVVPELGLFLVADGMGGHRGGETASAIVAQVVPEVVAEALRMETWNPRAVIVEAIRTANTTIFKKAAEDAELEGMGTTTTALLFQNNMLTIGHVGDSRCYYIVNNSLWQATRDHSLVQEKIRAGLITREQAKFDRMKNVITRSVGFEPAIDVEVYELEVKPGDALLLCSDGLSGLVTDEVILQIVHKSAIEDNDPKQAVEELIRRANENGGDDNVTAVIVKVS
ncbi:MAG TPA: Stp1/IreP family PP2C-type Ser/Thr phosphatase [Bdellovibrionales bacterium]|nr:MAG: hypothetical protein A2Z97_00490 [Bdellovibrionales bacterium GWB1_52_6]OFZ03245.1 MAG: hypothetical protein A2X97_09980 [Bdellovibrionales bacterium GWA1_52_35]OFZ38257.1 MAG: hypothetical protein A2070_05145 [Bdellovibrionales bacterium GWC1_52_8]HAR44347.1 Stp1/IreP family PP2C-type Ser/Thr phosphatase [Bdellovibrionales bacterium]HCM40572.1 Stp1/IreP family PP2C-type Ser/Thr phosphatase [Bdellovibrionales bacterium]